MNADSKTDKFLNRMGCVVAGLLMTVSQAHAGDADALTSKMEARFNFQVAADSTFSDLCATAMLVKEAWLQAGNVNKYKVWELRRQNVCGSSLQDTTPAQFMKAYKMKAHAMDFELNKTDCFRFVNGKQVAGSVCKQGE